MSYIVILMSFQTISSINYDFIKCLDLTGVRSSVIVHALS